MSKASFHSMKLDCILEELRGISYLGLFSKEMYTLSKSLNSYIYFETRRYQQDQDFENTARLQNSLKMDELLSFVFKKCLRLRKVIRRKEKKLQKEVLFRSIKRLFSRFVRKVSKKIDECHDCRMQTITLIPQNKPNFQNFMFPRIFGENSQNFETNKNVRFPSFFYDEKAVNSFFK